MSHSDQIILLSAKIHPSDKELVELNDLIPQITDWGYYVNRLIECCVGPLFHSKLSLLSNANLIPQEIKDKLQQSYYITLSRGMKMYSVFQTAMNALKSAGVDVMVLKGAYLADALYKDIALRQFSDIDLLIKEEDGEKSVEALKNIGFEADENDAIIQKYTDGQYSFIHYPHMVFQGISVELHVRLHDENERYQLLPDKIRQHAETYTLQGVEVNVQDLNDLLIFICVHLHKHFVFGHLQFTSFNDIVNILEVNNTKLEWDTLTGRCKEYDCEGIVFRYLLLAHKYYHAPVPDNIVQQNKIYLRKKDEELFLKYLVGEEVISNSVVSQFRNIKHIDGFFNKTKSFLYIVFPPKKYMVKSCDIKHPQVYWLYYPIRHWKGLKEIWKKLMSAE